MSGEAADETGDRKTDEGSPQEGEQAKAQWRGTATLLQGDTEMFDSSQSVSLLS